MHQTVAGPVQCIRQRQHSNTHIVSVVTMMKRTTVAATWRIRELLATYNAVTSAMMPGADDVMALPVLKLSMGNCSTGKLKKG